MRKVLIIISIEDGESIYNAMRLANLGVKKGDEISVFMLGKGVLFEKSESKNFDVMGQVNMFEGDFYVWGVCAKSHGLEGSSTCPIGWMDDLYELSMEADKVLTFWMEILLHTCCGPCTLYPVKELQKEGNRALVYFYNPNIHPFREYERRVEALEIASEKFKFPVLWDQAGYGLRDWLNKIGTRQDPDERCPVCYRIRLEATARKTAELGLPAFSTTLLYSRYQRHDLIRDIGKELASAYGIEFYYQDFRNGWVEGIEISKELGLYRQPYCGCIYSEEERYSKRAKRLQKRILAKSTEERSNGKKWTSNIE